MRPLELILAARLDAVKALHRPNWETEEEAEEWGVTRTCEACCGHPEWPCPTWIAATRPLR